MPWRLTIPSLVVLLAAPTIAQNIQGANGTGLYVPGTQAEQVGLLVDGTDGITGPHPVLPLYPLTAEWHASLPADGLTGTMFPTNSNTSSITSARIAWISCDPSDYPGYVSAVNVLESAVSANASAVILYSQVNAYCNYTAGPGVASTYNRIYSMANARQSAMFQEMFRSTSELSLPQAKINLEEKLDTNNGTGNGQGGNMSQQQPGGPSPSTAVAMIILYSITGVITALFLLIIVTGAIRAHRHPERYGPRAVLGRARQSRAKGLARAMLDSIPIVKFGDNEEDIPKPADVELTAGAKKETTSGAGEGSSVQDGDSATAPGIEQGETSVKPDTMPRTSRESEDGIRANTSEVAPTTQRPAQAQGCSICTEDFERGEDVRVLPCNHKFHPPCIDPWLLNVSGTCPLCRIDLRPPTSGNESRDDTAADSMAATPGSSDVISRLGVAAEESSSSRRHSHRLSFIFEPLNRRRMQDATPEERIEALRQYSQRHRNDDETRRRRRTSNRLSALLGRNRDQESATDRNSRSETPVSSGADRPALSSGDSTTHDRDPNAVRHDTVSPLPTVASDTALQEVPSADEAQATAGAKAPKASQSDDKVEAEVEADAEASSSTKTRS